MSNDDDDDEKIYSLLGFANKSALMVVSARVKATKSISRDFMVLLVIFNDKLMRN